MPINPVQPETKREVTARILSRHIEAVLIGLGFLLGAGVAIVAGVLT